MAKRHLECDLLTTDKDEHPVQCNGVNKSSAVYAEEGELKLTFNRKKDEQKTLGGRSPMSLKRPMAMTLPRLCLPAIIDDDLGGGPAHTRVFQSKDLTSSTSAEVLGSCQTRQKLSQSMPCLASSPVMPPTGILPFLFLGSLHDALSEEVFLTHDITHVLNVSTTCPRSSYVVDEEHFLRIPVNDGHNDRLLPFFQQAFHYIETVRKCNGCVLVHCLAGISRSATVVIAFIMHHLHMSMDEAYRFVKNKRPGISPNFNFLGQLMEFESQRKKSNTQMSQEERADEIQVKKACFVELKVPILPSPTTTFAKLNVNQSSPCSDASPLNAFKCLNPSPTNDSKPQSILTQTDSFQFASSVAANRRDISSSISLQLPSGHVQTILPLGSISCREKSSYECSRPEFPLTAVRSKETQRRPTTIAISRHHLPVPSEHVETLSNCSVECSHSPRGTDSVVAPPRSYRGNGSSPENAREKTSSNALIWQVEHACKSRSLEDILMRSENESRSLSNGTAAVDIFQPSRMDLGPHWQAEGPQSSGSVSSISSHTGSMHGSLEIMSVF